MTVRENRISYPESVTFLFSAAEGAVHVRVTESTPHIRSVKSLTGSGKSEVPMTESQPQLVRHKLKTNSERMADLICLFQGPESRHLS